MGSRWRRLVHSTSGSVGNPREEHEEHLDITRLNLRLIAFIVSLVTMLLAGWYLAFAPSVLRVAVSPAGGEVSQFLLALAKTLERERAPVRLVVVPVADSEQSSAAFDRHKVDLAVVRTDYVMPASALGIAVMHNAKALLAVREDSGITSLQDLRGRHVAVVGRGFGNRALFEKIIGYGGVASGEVTITTLNSLIEFHIDPQHQAPDAVFFAGPQGSTRLREGLRLFSQIANGPVRLLPIKEASLIARLNKPMSADEIAVGEITATPAWPTEASPTVAFPVLLVASNRLSKDVAYEFTRWLFSVKTALLRQHPVAGRIEALPTERDAFFAVHPGAATYFDANEVSFLERYSDALWLLVLGFGSFTSLAAWAASFLFASRNAQVRDDHGALLTLLGEARRATSLADIDLIEQRIDEVVAGASRQFLHGRLTEEQHPAFELVLARLAQVIEARRRAITG